MRFVDSDSKVFVASGTISRGYAFVDLGSQKAAAKAVTTSLTDGILIKGKRIMLEVSQTPVGPKLKKPSGLRESSSSDKLSRSESAMAVCGECGRSFGSEKSLAQHQSMTSCALKPPLPPPPVLHALKIPMEEDSGCWKCIANGRGPSVFKSHSAVNCKIFKGNKCCDKCIANGEPLKVFYSHTGSNCRIYGKKRPSEFSDVVSRLGKRPLNSNWASRLGKRPMIAPSS